MAIDDHKKCLELLTLWNDILSKRLPRAREITISRQRKCLSRLEERSIKEWKEVFEKIGQTPFLLGTNKVGWRATFDWIIDNDHNAVKVLEGKYDKVRSNTGTTIGEAKPKPGQYDKFS
jgi:hypothetical protein